MFQDSDPRRPRRPSRQLAFGPILAALAFGGCGDQAGPAAPTLTAQVEPTVATQPAHTDNRAIRLLKGSEVSLEPVGGWATTRVTTELRGQRGLRVDGLGGIGFYEAVFPCLETGCAPGTTLPLTLFIGPMEIGGVAKLQGEMFDVGGVSAGFENTGLVALTFSGSIVTPSSSDGVFEVTAPFTATGRLLYPSGLPQPHEAALAGSGVAVLTFEWQQIPLTEFEGWIATNARYVFD